MGNEHCPELADNHWAQSLGTEWAWEPKTGPRWGSPNTQFVQTCVAARGELCYPFVCVWSASGL